MDRLLAFLYDCLPEKVLRCRADPFGMLTLLLLLEVNAAKTSA